MVSKEGATWRALPKVYGNHWNAIYRRFSRGCDVGVFQALPEHFHDVGDISGILIDSTIVRAHSSAAGAPKKRGQEAEALGRSRGGFTTKLNLSLSDACIPLRFILTPGHRNDITQASRLIEGYCYKSVIGDKGYDSDAFVAEITSRDAIAVIPPRKGRTGFPREYDKELYKRRNLIERFFGWLKQFRRVATRYDKLGGRYLGFVYFAAILVTTRKM